MNAAASDEVDEKEAKNMFRKEKNKMHSRGYKPALLKARTAGHCEVALFLASLCDKVSFV